MEPINPTKNAFGNFNGVLRQAQSVYKALVGGLEIATPTGQDSNGIYNTFVPANQNGVMIRIGANGSGEPISWPAAANTGLVINHGLLRQPLGFHVTDTNGATTIYRVKSATLDSNNITLATTIPSVDATVFIF